MTRLHIKSLTHTPGTDTALVVVETETGTRTLGFFVPLNEANRLARVLGASPAARAPRSTS